MSSDIIGASDFSDAAAEQTREDSRRRLLIRAPFVLVPIGLVIGIIAIMLGGGGAEGAGAGAGGGDAEQNRNVAVPLLMLFMLLGFVAMGFAIRLARATNTRGISRRVLSIIVPLLVILMFPLFTVAVINANAKPEEQRRSFTPLGVQADYARRDTVQLTVRTQGEARPRNEIDLVPQVGGKIVYVSPNFIAGGIFKRGETLVRVDPSDYEVAVIRAEAAVAQAEQVLVREIAEGEIAAADFEELSTGTPSALALRQPQRQQAQAALTSAQADLENAKLQLRRTSVTAPFAGRVRSKASGVGQFVSPGTRLGQIFSTDIIEVRLPLTDSDLSKINVPLAYVAESRDVAPTVRLSTVIAGQPQVWEGRIMRTEAAYDTQSRALFAIAEVFDPYGSGASETGVPIAPGLFVDADIEGKTLENVIVIPRDGLRVEDEVYIVDNKGKAEIRQTVVLDTNSARAILSSGVEAGELVVLSPMERSRVSLPLQVLDVNDPTRVLVEPEEPEWMKRQNAGKRGGGDMSDTQTSDDESAENGEEGSSSTETSE